VFLDTLDVLALQTYFMCVDTHKGCLMHKLKELRTRVGFTQKELAEKLGTTQQTVARWESEHTGIPVAMLKDIAVLFGRSVDDLLGVERWPHQRKAAAVAQTNHAIPWGTLAIKFAFGTREYPIDESQRGQLRRAVRPDDYEFKGQKGWLEFTALDNRLVILNVNSLMEVHLVSDAAEGMPHFASPETYRSLTEQTSTEEIGPVVTQERQELIAQLAPEEPDAKKATLIAKAAMSDLRVVFADGREETFYLSQEAVTNIYILQDRLHEVGANVFLVVDEEGDEVLRFVNLSSVAALEVPLEKYLHHIADDINDADVAVLEKYNTQKTRGRKTT
jgi:transcriptional regulator with XRE-family HTH domain